MKDFHALLTLYLIWHATELCWRYVQSPKIGTTFTNSMQNKWFPDRFVSLIQGFARDWPRERKGGLICKSSTKSYLFFYARLECIDSGLIICNVKLSTFQLRNSARFSKNLRFWRNATHNFLISAKKSCGSRFDPQLFNQCKKKIWVVPIIWGRWRSVLVRLPS